MNRSGNRPSLGAHGGAFFDSNGAFYTYDNGGSFFRYDFDATFTNVVVTEVSDAEASSQNDAASCPGAAPEAIPGVAKAMTVSGNGPWTIDIAYTVENFGDDILSAMSMTDDLEAVFGTEGTDWELTSLTATGATAVVANADFDGETGGDIELLGADSELLPGETDTVTATISLNTPGTYNNEVVLDGESKLTGVALTDDSVSGIDPDLDDDDDPSNDESITTITCLLYTSPSPRD